MFDITGNYIELRGTRAYYETAGRGPTIFLIHTAGRDGRQWHGVIEALAEHYRLIAVDLPGHGRSWPLPGNRCLEDIYDFGAWLTEFIQSICKEDMAIVGCSIGANLALLLGATLPFVRGVVAMDGADYTPVISDGGLELITHPQIAWYQAGLDSSMSLVGTQATDEGRAFAEWGALSLIPVSLKGDLRAFARCDIRGLMPRINSPVLLLRGTADWIVPKSIMEGTKQRLQPHTSVELQELSGLGHFPHLEDPKRLASIVRPFLDTCFSRTSVKAASAHR